MRLIDADALKKSVLDLHDCYNGFSDTYDKACIIGVIDEEPTIELDPYWIPCSERLPFAEYGESPNVYCYCHDVERGGKWAEMLYFNGGVWCKPTGETFDYKVLAWYPLPQKPYRAEGGEDENR